MKDNTSTGGLPPAEEFVPPVKHKKLTVSGPCADLERQHALIELASKAGKVQMEAAIEKQLQEKEKARQAVNKESMDLKKKLKDQIGKMAVAAACGLKPLVDLASAATKLFGGTVRVKDLIGAVHYFNVPHGEDLTKAAGKRYMEMDLTLNFQMPVLASTAYRKKHELSLDQLEEGEEGDLVHKSENLRVLVLLSQPMINDMLKLQALGESEDMLEQVIKLLQKKREDGAKLLDQAVAVSVRNTLRGSAEGARVLQDMDSAISLFLGSDSAFLNLLDHDEDE